MIVGPLAAQDRTDLDWFESKPLFGWRVLVPRTKDGATPMATRLRSYGAASQEVATISIERPRTPHQMDRAIRGLVDGEFEWIAFTSPNSVRAVREKIEEYGLDARAFSGLKVAAVGGATADALTPWASSRTSSRPATRRRPGSARCSPSTTTTSTPSTASSCRGLTWRPRASRPSSYTAAGVGTSPRTGLSCPAAALIREGIKAGA